MSGVVPALAANVLLRVAGQAAGLALTRRLAVLSTVGPNEVGFLGGLADAMELLVALPAGVLSDRWGRRPLLLAGATLGAIGLLVVGFTETLPLLALGRALQGLGTGCTIPPLLGWFSDMTASQGAAGRARVMSGVGAGTAAGLLFGTVLGSVLWTQLGTNAFPLLALLFFLSTALMAGAPGVAAATTKPLPLGEAARSAGEGGPSYAQSRPHPGSGFPLEAERPGGKGIFLALRHVLRAPGLLRLLVAWMLLNAVVGLWLTHAVYQLDAAVSDTGQFLVGRFHGSTLDVLLGAWMLLFIVGSLAWAPLLPRVGEWRAMRIALSGMLLVCASLVVINAGPLPVAARWAALVPFCIGVLMEAGFAPAALAQLAAGSQQSHRGLTMALYSVAFGSGSLLGNWAGAPFVAAGAMNGIIVATAIMASLALATLSLGYRPGGAARVHSHEHGETRAAVIAA